MVICAVMMDTFLTAWSVKHKVMQSMKERDDQQPNVKGMTNAVRAGMRRKGQY